MRVILDGQAHTLDDRDLVGEGGEARVYALPCVGGADDVVKVFHANAPAALRALREQKLKAFPAGLPAAVVAPISLAHDDAGAVIGYRMRRIVGAVDIAALAKPAAHAAAASGSQNATLSLFRALLTALDGLHAKGVVIGDFNDGNVVVAARPGAAGAPFIIDADSMQIGALPCPVAHERFLDPRLFGVSLVDGPAFTADHDHYALRVLLFQSLCCVHPYGGTHATLPTLLRRAEARHSVLRDDVTLPKMALPARALPEALLHDLRACFDDDVRVPLSPTLLDARFVRCACGLEHARTSCPACQVRVVVPAFSGGHPQTPGLIKGAVSFEHVARGRVVHAAAFGGSLRFVIDDGSVLRRENGDAVVEGAGEGITVGVHDRRTWLALGTELVCVDGAGSVVDRTSTGPVYGAAAFAVSPVGLFRLHGDAILHHDSGVVVGRAVVGRTWLFPTDDGCLAIWRAGNIARALWCRPGEAPVDVALPALAGRVVELHVVVDGEHAMISAAVDTTVGTVGARLHRITLLQRRRGVTAHLEGRPDEHAVLGNVRGKLLSGSHLLSTSTRGLTLLDGDLREQARFTDTEGLVDDGVDLLRGSGGDVFAVSDAAIHLLRRRAATSASAQHTATQQPRSTP